MRVKVNLKRLGEKYMSSVDKERFLFMATEAFERGLATRKRVLGEAYVDASLASMDTFTAPLQKVITEWAWDANWNREALSPRDRSLLNLVMMTALNRPAEFRIHMLGALNNGVTVPEIQDALLQSAAYCGIPAALDSFNIAKEVLAEWR
jgi:4-carboxymuconolactone decarboxylase